MKRTTAIRKYADAVEAAKWNVSHGLRVYGDAAATILAARTELLRQEIELEESEDVRHLLCALATAEALRSLVVETPHKETLRKVDDVLEDVRIHVAALLVAEWYADEAETEAPEPIILTESEPAMANGDAS